jgi:HAT1-interacting factor 1
MSIPEQQQPLDTVAEDQTPQIENREQAQADLARLQAAATREYSLKNYAAASEFYSQASELQELLNGEMSLDNADLLYQYGRCLYHLAVSKSDVLGNKVAGSGEPQKKKRKTKSAAATTDALKDGEQKMAEEVVEAVVDEKDGSATKNEAANKPFFQITGDENWTDSEDEGDDAEDDGEEEEEDDDFAIAYEILDIARVLLTRKLDTIPQHLDGKGKGKATLVENPEARTVMDRLADTHDLQAELSMENENFPEAVAEGRSALELKQKLYPLESSLLAEAHFKLALAMEFASVTTTNAEAVEQGAQKEETVDEDLRKEAVTHMESAIESCRLRVEKEESTLSSHPADKQEAKKKEIKDVKEMMSEMEQRLIDLKTPVAAAENPLRGILGGMLGETPTDQKQRIAEATANANDLSGLTKKKKKVVAPVAAAAGPASKRKLEDEEVQDASSKKAKVEDEVTKEEA